MRRHRVFCTPGNEDDLRRTIEKKFGDGSVFSIYKLEQRVPGNIDAGNEVSYLNGDRPLPRARAAFAEKLTNIGSNGCIGYTEVENDGKLVIRGHPVRITYRYKFKNVVLIRKPGVVFVGEDAGPSSFEELLDRKNKIRRLLNAQRFPIDASTVRDVHEAVAYAYSPDTPISSNNVGVVVPEIKVFGVDSVSHRDSLNDVLQRRLNFKETQELNYPMEYPTRGSLCIYETRDGIFLVGINAGLNDDNSKISLKESIEIDLSDINPTPSLYSAVLDRYSERAWVREDVYIALENIVSELSASSVLKNL